MAFCDREPIMSRLPYLTLETAPVASHPYISKSIANNGFLPNLVAALSNAPTAVETYFTVGEINGRSGLTLAEREAVQITAAVVHGCGFCVAGHTAIAYKKAQLDDDIVQALRKLTPVPDARLNAVAAFTQAVIATRGAVDDDAYQAFIGAGFTQANALEVVLGISLATLCNFANNLAQTALNPQLQQYAWEPQDPAAT
jgi:uncharacterized peroxidase-related enzyme